MTSRSNFPTEWKIRIRFPCWKRADGEEKKKKIRKAKRDNKGKRPIFLVYVSKVVGFDSSWLWYWWAGRTGRQAVERADCRLAQPAHHFGDLHSPDLLCRLYRMQDRMSRACVCRPYTERQSSNQMPVETPSWLCLFEFSLPPSPHRSFILIF